MSARSGPAIREQRVVGATRKLRIPFTVILPLCRGAAMKYLGVRRSETQSGSIGKPEFIEAFNDVSEFPAVLTAQPQNAAFAQRREAPRTASSALRRHAP
jgi:hypothetical protein